VPLSVRLMNTSRELTDAPPGAGGQAARQAGGQSDWLQRDRRRVGQSAYLPPLVLERGQGCELWDVDGRRFLDFESGQFCMSTGHSHPRVTQAICDQAQTLMQIGNRFTNRPRILLAERLAGLVPDPLGVSFFCSTGSEANETAIRIAKLVTGRFEVVALARGYHGRTSTAYSASSSHRQMRRNAGPPAPGIQFAVPPYPFRCDFACGSCDLRCWRHSVEMLDRASSGEPAAVIAEFVLGAGGIIPVPPEWARAVRRFCDERGALLIADEALTGLGRTGRWFAFEHSGLVPDIVVTSKALGGGVPTAAIITTREIADAAVGRGFVQAASHQGDPVQCAVALANLTVMEEEGLLLNAERMGRRLADGLESLAMSHEIVGEARGIGLIAGLEIVDGQAEAPEQAGRVSLACMKRGLIVGGLRPGIREGNTLRLAPPLTVTAAEIDEALSTLHAALEEVEAGC
jgi:2,2-dialkylglycine decarboxylase (pyruvate)